MANELKPCPFCGGEAIFMTSRINDIVRCFATCTVCGCETPRIYRTWEQLKEVWNRRATNDL